MILAYVANDSIGSLDNARTIAKQQWPGESVEARNPARIRGAVETAGVSAVIIAGEHPHLVQLYRREEIPVIAIAAKADPAFVPAAQSLTPIAPFREELAEEMCRIEAARLCALVRSLSDAGVLACMDTAERRAESPRKDVLQCVADRREEIHGT